MVASIRCQSVNCCFLWGTARTGTNLVCHVLEQADGVECHNEDSEAAFVKCFLKDNSVLMALVETCPKPAIFFKSFNDTPRARTVMNFFTEARAVYTLRQPDECIASFVQEFGSMGFQEWQKRLTEGAGGRSGRLLTMVSADRELYEYTRLTAANAVEMMDRYGRTPHNVAAVY